MTAPVCVGGQARHQVARAVNVEKAHVLILQAREQPHAQVHQRVLGGMLQQDNHQVAQTFARNLDNQHRQQQADERFGVLRDNDVIHQAHRQVGVDEQHQRRDGTDDEAKNVPLVVALVHYAPQPFDILHRLLLIQGRFDFLCHKVSNADFPFLVRVDFAVRAGNAAVKAASVEAVDAVHARF